MGKSIFTASAWSFQPVKLAVVVPVRDMVHSVFASSLTAMMKTNTQAGIDTHIIFDASTVLLNQRERLAQQALEINADYMLWLDSDMVFPSTTALRLLSHKKDIVAVNYMKRANPLTTVAYEEKGNWENWLPLEHAEELVEVEAIGMGCVLMRTSLFAEIEAPWFSFTWIPETKDWMGEDFYMFDKLKEKGHKILVDMNLSTQVRHIGNWAFGPSIGSNSEQIAKRASGIVKKGIL